MPIWLGAASEALRGCRPKPDTREAGTRTDGGTSDSGIGFCCSAADISGDARGRRHFVKSFKPFKRFKTPDSITLIRSDGNGGLLWLGICVRGRRRPHYVLPEALTRRIGR